MFAVSETVMAFALTISTLLFIGVSIWWLYLSPVKRPIGELPAPSPRFAASLAALLGLSTFQLVVGALWDASMHLLTGEVPGGSDFLWPPHLLIYSSFLIALVIALVAIAVIARPAWRQGVRDPRSWVRGNPYLAAVALASLYSLMAVPGDALWHELFGIDLTAWSPPHLMLAAAGAAVVISAIGVLLHARRNAGGMGWTNIAIVLLLGLVLNVVYIIGVLEWEMPGLNFVVAQRPLWFYPLVSAALAFFVLVLAKRLVPLRWSATGTAAAFYAFRLAVSLGLGLTGNIVPAVPMVFILGAVLIDAIPWSRLPSLLSRDLAAAGLFTLGFAALAFPVLMSRSQSLPFTVRDLVTASIAILLVTLILFPVGQLAAERLAGEKSRWGNRR